ncbi:MAG: hypothetical protein QME28_05450 [Candidatus Saccharicenans sp.]|nr:hypothetical protein [Candidatus Saccharicenans sp.]
MSSRKILFSLTVLTICLVALIPAVAFAQSAQSQVKEFEGVVKTAAGNYMYIPQAQGLDIYVAGNIPGGIESLIGKEVRIRASLLPDKTNLILAESIEIKEGTGYNQVYTRTAEPDFAGYFDPHVRDEYKALNITSLNKPEEWEGKEKIKVYGKLETSKVKEGGQEKEVTHIVILDNKGKEVARIIVNNITDYASFYLKKLRLFDRFWFYVTVTGQVDKKVRARTKEILSGDVVFCGLF